MESFLVVHRFLDVGGGGDGDVFVFAFIVNCWVCYFLSLAMVNSLFDDDAVGFVIDDENCTDCSSKIDDEIYTDEILTQSIIQLIILCHLTLVGII